MKPLIASAVTAAFAPMLGEAFPSESLVVNLVKQVPAAASVLIMVYMGLKFLKSERKQSERFILLMHNDHMEARKLSREALEANTKTIEQNIHVTEKNNALLDQLIQERQRHPRA